MPSRLIPLSIIALALGGAVIWLALESRAPAPKVTNTDAGSVTFNEHGLRFMYPASYEPVDVPSTTGRYANYRFHRPGDPAANYSSVEIYIPLQVDPESQSLAAAVRPFADLAGIRPTTLNGIAGETITYRHDRTAPGDVPWSGSITREHYATAFAQTPLVVVYAHGDGNDAMEQFWKMFRETITVESDR